MLKKKTSASKLVESDFIGRQNSVQVIFSMQGVLRESTRANIIGGRQDCGKV